MYVYYTNEISGETLVRKKKNKYTVISDDNLFFMCLIK